MIALLVIAVYIFVLGAVFRALWSSSRIAAVLWALVWIGIPTWFLHGYRISGSYREFLAECEDNDSPYLVKPVPTSVPYSGGCWTAKSVLRSHAYAAAECTIGDGTHLRYTFTGRELAHCQRPYPEEYDEECLASEPIDEITTPYIANFGRTKEILEDRFFVGRLRVSETTFTLPDGTLVAYSRNYIYLPYGNAIWMGYSSGAAPQRYCKVRPALPKLEEMFPPLAY